MLGGACCGLCRSIYWLRVSGLEVWGCSAYRVLEFCHRALYKQFALGLQVLGF